MCLCIYCFVLSLSGNLGSHLTSSSSPGGIFYMKVSAASQKCQLLWDLQDYHENWHQYYVQSHRAQAGHAHHVPTTECISILKERQKAMFQSENLLANTKMLRCEKWERGDASFHPFVHSLYSTALCVQRLPCQGFRSFCCSTRGCLLAEWEKSRLRKREMGTQQTDPDLAVSGVLRFALLLFTPAYDLSFRGNGPEKWGQASFRHWQCIFGNQVVADTGEL